MGAGIESRESAIGKLRHDLGITMVRHDYKHSVYHAFLTEFPPAAIREYFEHVPLVIDGREFRGRPLYELLRKKKALVPLEWEVRTDNYLEEFLVSHDRDPKQMMPKILG